ncbi:energy-converting hydrogenase B subunit EhbP [Methanobrevibacter sp. DSM 116169]|uniref:energy-converting hydrogenase B subunit EhbP n=1 Tax=Methanobrevibacter sp. DSM 116169 TaxID=3242727 RepID=UPI0038FC55C6
MKFVIRPWHIISLAGYIVERNFPYRNIIVVNKSDEPVKLEVPVFEESWIQDHRDLGLEIIPVSDEDNFLKLYKLAHADLQNELNI